jgi:hypothetical protein
LLPLVRVDLLRLKSATTTKGTAENITKLTEDIIHIHSGMTSASTSAKTSESKLVTVLIVFCFFCLGH